MKNKIFSPRISKAAKTEPIKEIKEIETFVPQFLQHVWYEADAFNLVTYYQDEKDITIRHGRVVGTENRIMLHPYEFLYENTIRGDFEFIKNSKEEELQRAKDFMETKAKKDKEIITQLEILNSL